MSRSGDSPSHGTRTEQSNLPVAGCAEPMLQVTSAQDRMDILDVSGVHGVGCAPTCPLGGQDLVGGTVCWRANPAPLRSPTNQHSALGILHSVPTRPPSQPLDSPCLYIMILYVYALHPAPRTAHVHRPGRAHLARRRRTSMLVKS